jgi:hypothetical protein
MKPKKLYTPQEANRTLPLVKRIVSDINEAGKDLQGRAKFETIGEESPEFKGRLRHMERLIEELEYLGCYYKDWNFDVGLVDFPSLIDGEHVLLCWRSDEPEVRFYHSYEGGYAGRQRIPECYLLQLPAPARR